MTIFTKIRDVLRPQKRVLTFAIINKFDLALPVAPKEQWTVEPPNAPTREEAEAFVKLYSFWYHRVYQGNGVYTMLVFSRSSPNYGVQAASQELNSSKCFMIKPSISGRSGRWIPMILAGVVEVPLLWKLR